MAAADEDDRGRTLAQGGAQPGKIVDDRRRQQLDLSAARLQWLRQTGRSGPRSMPCGWASSFSRLRPSGRAPKPSP